MKILAAILLTATLVPSASAAVVKVEKTATGFELRVDGKAFVVKGVGCNTQTGPDGVDYLAMARDLGANAVRTWGITPRSYFDKAHEYGLMVDAGIWLNPIRGDSGESYRNPAYCEKLKAQALAHVRDLKDHPALLMWNIGNEVFAFTESEDEKQAFGRFLEDLVKAVKAVDPNHPVIYASSSGTDFPYLKSLVPSVDIVGINTYGGYRAILARMATGGDLRPGLATEYGPLGAWDVKKDVNGLPYDPDDHIKAGNYAELWNEILTSGGRSLGGFAFVLGDSRNQDSLTWWNLNEGALKRPGYWAIYTAYTGKQPTNNPPRIRLLKVNRVTALDPGSAIELEVSALDPDGDPLSYKYLISDIATDPLVVQQPRFFPAQIEDLSSDRSHVKIHVPNNPGSYRVYALVSDGHGNVAVANRSLKVEPLSQGTGEEAPR